MLNNSYEVHDETLEEQVWYDTYMESILNPPYSFDDLIREYQSGYYDYLGI